MLQLTGLNAQLALPILFSFADRIHDLVSLPCSLLFQSPPKEKALLPPQITQPINSSISKEEVGFVMEKLGFLGSNEEGFGGDEIITSIFDENEPSFEELNQAFNVFDKNRDGFIDAEELHSVLGLLGSNEGLFIHDCQRMIARFDLNKDGKIDIFEFVKLMEIAFCSE